MFESISQKFSTLFSRLSGRLTEGQLEKILADVQEALLEADVPYDVVVSFVAELKADVVGKKLIGSLKPEEQLMKVMHDKVVAFLGSTGALDGWTPPIPSIIMVLGLQGSGKTTTTAKLAYYIKEQAAKRGKQRRILLASVDFYRPAAIDQLEINARSVGVDFYRAQSLDPVKASQEIAAHAQKNGYEYLFLDTAGRLHVDQALMQELASIDQLIKPRQKILVLDAMTGQESLNVAQSFDQRISFQYAILTKIDSQTRAGAAFAFRYVLKKDILFVGNGEKITDLEVFRPQRMASRMLGMGDMMTLVERAQEKIKESETEKMQKSLVSGKFTLEDFAQQLEMMGRLGSLSSLMKYMPGLPGKGMPSAESLEQGEKELKKFKAVLSSMTQKERINPGILNVSRKERISRGAGVSVKDINLLLERFEQTQQFVKIFKKMGKFNPFFK